MRFAARSRDATSLAVCLFDAGDRETRIEMTRAGEDLWVADVPDARPGQRYGLRADGPWAPEAALRFDPDKLLVDPYAVELDRRFAYDPRLTLWRGSGVDTASLVPKAVVPAPRELRRPPPPVFRAGGLIYELNVRGFSLRHPDVPEALRGTVGALGHPAVVDHLRRLRVSAVELMPVVAAIDERHLAALGLSNAWGYNPVAPMALDPRLCPGGIDELAATVAALREAGIGVVLDLVFNHTGESDVAGPTLSLRGLDNRTFYAHAVHAPDVLVNDTGTGNTLDFAEPPVRELTVECLRWFAGAAGVDGFRFDLAAVLGRGPEGFHPAAPMFAEIAADPLLADRVMIAEPWDTGPGGYQLGAFPSNWLEWNDRYRDDVRRFWRSDPGTLGALATRLAGSSDVFGAGGARGSRTVNFVAAHDGFTLADLVSFTERRNLPNGEDNRDGHGDNLSWNGGAEGATDDPAVLARRAADRRALLATLFASRGAIMLTAGDEFGRTQDGNNNAYAQDNETTWLDWERRDRELEAFTAGLAAFRAAHPELADPAFLPDAPGVVAVEWLGLDGVPLTPGRWASEEGLEFVLTLHDGRRLSVRVDRTARSCELSIS